MGFLGLVDLSKSKSKSKVRAVRRIEGEEVGRRSGGRGSFETYTFDSSPATTSLASLGGGGGEGRGVALTQQPVLLLEYCAYGTIDTFVKTHPELVNEEVWTRWVGVLGSAGEWLQERGVVREFSLSYYFISLDRTC